MAYFDVLERIPFSILRRIHDKSQSGYPYELLQEKGLVKGGHPYYFNYGRNALLELFSTKRFTGKKIVFPAFTCPYLPLAAMRAGAIPVFADISLDDFNIDVKSLGKLLGHSEIEAVFAVHTLGFPLNMEKILELKEQHKFEIIEDIAHSLFAKYKNRYTGNFGDYVLVSMYKQIPNFHGAALLSRNRISELEKGPQEKQRVRPDEIVRLSGGLHERLVDMARRRKALPSTPLALGKTKKPDDSVFTIFEEFFGDLEKGIDKKQILADFYVKRSAKSKYFIPPKIQENTEPAWFTFTMRLKPEFSYFRDKLLNSLKKKKIFADRIWHDSPVMLQEFRDHCIENKMPNAQILARSVINLPIRKEYDKEDVDMLFNIIEQEMDYLAKED